MKLYPKAEQRRLSISHPAVRKSRLAVLKAAAINGILLSLLFLALFSYLFGSLYQQTGHIHNLNVLFVDYDGGVIGTAVRDAFRQLRGDSFPTLMEHEVSRYPQPSALRSAVCNIDYWGALYTSPNASDRLGNALAGGVAASSYNRSDVLTFIWNEARYPAVIDTLYNDIKTLSETARVAYTTLNGTGAIQTLSTSNSTTAISIFSNPWTLTSTNIQPTTQGSRLIYNTLVIILILIQEFFFLATVNGLYAQFKLFGRLSPRRMIIVRFLISATYALVGSLCTAGAIWAFRAGWHVNGAQWALTWLCLWLFGHLNFLTLDVFSVWLPPPFVPMALITWVVLNVSSILLPFELSPAFYHWAYALPAHAVFQVLLDIWSGGCNPQLAYALPVLFAYEISSGILSGIGVYRRSHYAVIAVEREEKAFQEKIAAALAENEESPSTEDGTEDGGEAQPELGEEGIVPARRVGTLDTVSGREELAERIWRETTEMKQEQTNARGESLGPTFTLPSFD